MSILSCGVGGTAFGQMVYEHLTHGARVSSSSIRFLTCVPLLLYLVFNKHVTRRSLEWLSPLS